MNYDKWSKLDADGEEEEESVDVGAEIEKLKANADGLFEANESKVGLTASYKECIGLYQRVLHLIDEKKDLLELSIRCQLNLACCFIRESEWQLAIKHGQLAFQLCTEEHWNEQLRARYFELHSLCKLALQNEQASRAGLHAQLVLAERNATDMKKSLQFHAALVSPEHLADYERVFQQLEECVARADRDVEASAESHFEKALQYQRGGSDLKAAAELARCAALTHTLRTPAHLLSSAKMHLLAAAIYYKHREYTNALQHYTLAHSLCTSDHTTFNILTSIAVFGITTCNLKLRRELLTTASDTHNTLCSIEICVFSSTITSDSNSAFLSHMLTPTAHDIASAALYTNTTTTSTASTAHSANATKYAYILHLLHGYSLLADVHAQLEEWDLCNDATDRTIDTCNALIAQFAPANSNPDTVFTWDTTTTTTSDSANILVILQRARAGCFVAKAMLYKDHTLTTTNTAITNKNTANTNTANTTHTWPAVLPPLAKHSSVYNQNSSMHRVHYDTSSEAVAVYLQVAGSEYERFDCVQSMRTFHTLAEYIMKIADIQPFRFDTNATTTDTSAIDKKDLAEKAADAWLKVSLQASRQTTTINTTITTLITKPTQYETLRTHYFDQYYYLQQSMLALYYAGVCCVVFDLTLSQRHLEASEEVRRDIDALLSGELKSEFNLGQPTVSGVGIGSSTSGNGGKDSMKSTDSSSSGDGTSIKVEPFDFGSSDKSTSPLTLLTTTTTTHTNTVTNTTNTTAESRSLHSYYSICGDVSYHLAQVYMRQGEYTQALESASAALAYYEHSERLLYLLHTLTQTTSNTTNTNTNSTTAAKAKAKAHDTLLTMGVVGLHLPLSETTPGGRLNQRLALTVCVLCHSARGEDKLVEQGVQRLGDLCLGPVEDADREMRFLQHLLSQQRRSIEKEMQTTSASGNSGGGRGSPPSIPAPLAVDGNMVRNIKYNYDSDSEVKSTKSSAKSGKLDSAGAIGSGASGSGISNVRMERVPNKVKRRIDYNLLIAYSIVSVVVIAIVVAVFSK